MNLNIFKTALITIALVAGSMAHTQSAHDETIYVSNTDIYNLGLDQKSLSIGVSYPGPRISAVCGIELRADSYGRHKPIQNLLTAIKVKHSSGHDMNVRIINESTLLFRLPIGGYGFWFSIETKDGSTLKQAIKDNLGNGRTVVLLGSSCL